MIVFVASQGSKGQMNFSKEVDVAGKSEAAFLANLCKPPAP